MDISLGRLKIFGVASLFPPANHRIPNRWDEPVMKMPSNTKLIYDTATGRARIVEQISPKLDASKKIAIRKSKKTRVVRRVR
jgi:hypothetical protein